MIPPFPHSASNRNRFFPGVFFSARDGGFTLIEVLLSLGIVAFAFMALCGVLPVGLQNYRDAMDATCRANIVRVISAELAQAPYASIDARNGTERFFSDQGLEVGTQGEARFRVKYESILSGTTMFDATNASLKPVTIDISSVQGGRSLSRVTLFISDNGI
ncbi:MAG: Verru_Chthon cassette protein B [Verrucomicrobiae bacterium]